MKYLLLFLLVLFPVVTVHAAQPLPGDSIYQLRLQLTDQDGHTQPLSARRGRPQLLAMFYASCQMVCPMIVDSLRATYKALPTAKQGKLDLLLVSFDPARDSVAALKRYAEKRQLSTPPWTLTRAEAPQVRQLSGVLGLQYRQLPDGEFNHSSELILLDAEGRIVARTTHIGRLDKAFVDEVAKQLDAH